MLLNLRIQPLHHISSELIFYRESATPKLEDSLGGATQSYRF